MSRFAALLALIALLMWPVEGSAREIYHLDQWHHCLTKIGEDVFANQGYEIRFVECFDKYGGSYLISSQLTKFRIPQDPKLVRIRLGFSRIDRQDPPQGVTFEMSP